MKALNEDAEKLMSEYQPRDPELRQLQDEMRKCNKIFEQLSAKARAEGETWHGLFCRLRWMAYGYIRYIQGGNIGSTLGKILK